VGVQCGERSLLETVCRHRAGNPNIFRLTCHMAYAVPAWPSYIAEQLEPRGSVGRARRFSATEDEAGTALADWLPKLVRGFASEQPTHGLAGYGWN
jgi:hypothetical protein